MFKWRIIYSSLNYLRPPKNTCGRQEMTMLPLRFVKWPNCNMITWHQEIMWYGSRDIGWVNQKLFKTTTLNTNLFLVSHSYCNYQKVPEISNWKILTNRNRVSPIMTWSTWGRLRVTQSFILWKHIWIYWFIKMNSLSLRIVKGI